MYQAMNYKSKSTHWLIKCLCTPKLINPLNTAVVILLGKEQVGDILLREHRVTDTL